MRAGFLMAAVLFVAWRGAWASEASEYLDKYGRDIMAAAALTKYAKVATLVAAIGWLESDAGRAAWVEDRKQVFAMKANRKRAKGERPINLLLRFKSFDESTAAVLDLFRRRGFPADRAGFLDRLDSSGYHATGTAYRVRLLKRKRLIINELKKGE
jgi:hypothetical protein